MTLFRPADILLPSPSNMEKWPVIACDQYTSQPEYWINTRAAVGDAVSTLHLILPEAELQPSNDQKLASIHQTMQHYAATGQLDVYPNSFIYVERTLSDGSIRPGIVGVVDLEAYDYREGSSAPIRATEKTVAERIPPRRAIRQDSALDMSHILMLADDEENIIFGSLSDSKTYLTQLYSMDLTGNGGHICGWLIDGCHADALVKKIQQYETDLAAKLTVSGKEPVLYVIGDGNHSLAAAKDCYELEKRRSPGTVQSALRYALVEMLNVHSPSLQLEPIHRLIETTDPKAFLNELVQQYNCTEGVPVHWFLGDEHGILYLDNHIPMVLTVLQPALDALIQQYGGSIDYIHGDATVVELAARKNALGLQLPPVEKSHFFESILTNGVLPRKSFSMGHAQEKRYYLETRLLSKNILPESSPEKQKGSSQS